MTRYGRRYFKTEITVKWKTEKMSSSAKNREAKRMRKLRCDYNFRIVSFWLLLNWLIIRCDLLMDWMFLINV